MSWHVWAGCVQCTGTWGDTHRSDRRGDIASSAVAANQHYSCYLPLVVILLSLCEESPARPSDSSLTEDFWMWKLYWNMWSSTLTKVCKIMSRKLEAQLKHAFPSLGLGRIWEKSGKAFCWGAISTDALLALRALSKLYPDMWAACELHETSWDWIIWDWIRLNHTEGKNGRRCPFWLCDIPWLITWNATTALPVESWGNEWVQHWQYRLSSMLPHLGLFWEESDRTPTDRSAMEEPVMGSRFVKWHQINLDLTFMTFRVIWSQLVLDSTRSTSYNIKHHLRTHTQVHFPCVRSWGITFW